MRRGILSPLRLPISPPGLGMATWESRLGRKDCYYTQIPGGFGKCHSNFFKFSLVLKTFPPKVRLKLSFPPALSQLLKH
ncbi:protein of unknown function [Alcaligenes faecalis subsp. faecalis]|nr:protein of unknown function [Alcaligenes faecalis subsp. faecalis]